MHYDLRDEQLQRDILQWDVATWARALFYWEQLLDRQLAVAGRAATEMRALELGAHDGGLSLYLALRGISVLCSDLQGPTTRAHELHERYGVTGLIDYAALDATAIAAADGSFDLVIFKSVMGGVGTFGSPDSIRQVLAEVRRVLKPGGLLLFAENQCGSAFHRFARSHFVRWGRQWYYPTLAELDSFLEPFACHELYSYGFFSCCLKDCAPVAALDRLVCRAPCSPRHYMAFGSALIR